MTRLTIEEIAQSKYPNPENIMVVGDDSECIVMEGDGAVPDEFPAYNIADRALILRNKDVVIEDDGVTVTIPGNPSFVIIDSGEYFSSP